MAKRATRKAFAHVRAVKANGSVYYYHRLAKVRLPDDIRSPAFAEAWAAAVLSLAELKAALRISHDDHDTFLTLALAAAQTHLEGWDSVTKRALVNQSWRVAVPNAGKWGRLFAPLAPCSAATAIQYYAPDADTLSNATLSDFRLIKGPDWAYLEPKDGKSWPSLDDRPDALQAVFTCGYGAAGTDVPAPLRHALILLCGHLNENREETTALRLEKLPFGFESLVNPYRLGFYG